MEAVVSRMKTIQVAVNNLSNNNDKATSTMRFLAISATIPNVGDVRKNFYSNLSKTQLFLNRIDKLFSFLYEWKKNSQTFSYGQ